MEQLNKWWNSFSRYQTKNTGQNVLLHRSATDWQVCCRRPKALGSLKTVCVYLGSHNHFPQVMGNGFPIFLFSSPFHCLSIDPHLLCQPQNEEICIKYDTESQMIQIICCVSCVAWNTHTKKLRFVTSRDCSCHRQEEHSSSLFEEGMCYRNDAVRCWNKCFMCFQL